MMLKRFISLAMLLHALNLFSQTSRISSYEKIRQEWSPVNEVKFRNIGPSVMSGRVTDLEVNPENPNEFYVAYASGGLWHTGNNGQSMDAVFDHEATITIGDLAVDWKNHRIWIGTGEANASRSSYAGVGVYVSDDMGKTWQHRGLEESHHISKVLLHPKNDQIAWVAVMGHLYTDNSERGIYKTIDGGLHWTRVLYIDDSTGCIDLQHDARNPDILYTCTWTRTRKAWQFNGTGEENAIYKSHNGGDDWQRITTKESGFPAGSTVGRIGITVYEKDPRILYALVDNHAHQPEKKEDGSAGKKMSARDLEKLSKAEFLLLDNQKLNEYLKQNGYPEKYNAETLKNSITRNEFTVKDIADWKLSDADANLFDTPIYGAELYRSNDGGTTWYKTHTGDMSGVYFTYGYYFGTLQVSPNNPDKILVGGYPILMSVDGGSHFRQIDGENCHPDYHRIWIDPKNDKHMITGNDGGVNITYDDGKNWYKANNPAVGQFYAIQVDDAQPYNVYGGLQDNGTWMGPSTNTESTAWHQSGEYAYKNIGGGDGMQVQVDTRNNTTYFAGYQFGNYYMATKNGNTSVDLKPVHDIGEKAFRFNWQTPILLSRHNQDIFYLGSNRLHRSLRQGEKMETISEDLTLADKKGNVPFNTLTSLSESPVKFGFLYTGSDDGLVHFSKDGGYTFSDVSRDLPEDRWVSRVCASKHKESRVYVTLNGYRNDDFTPYIFVSENYGQAWKQIGRNLPQEPVNVIKEDPKDENILYAGTDNGLYVSFDKGDKFSMWNGNLPRVAVHDIAIQERENEIILGTHGRSVYIAKLDKLQHYNKIKGQDWAIIDLEKIKYDKRIGNKSYSYSEPHSDKVNVWYFTSLSGSYDINVFSSGGTILYKQKQEAKKGYNVFEYDLSINTGLTAIDGTVLKVRDDGKYYLPAGKYKIEFTTPRGEKHSAPFEITEKKDQ